jgi:acetoin utilization protein AcuB
MLVRHFMTEAPFTLAPQDSCREALQEFRNRRVRRAPVVEKGRLVGIVSERDLLHVLPGTPGEASTCAGEECLKLPVRAIMRAPVITLKPNDHLAAAAKLMLTHRIGGVPVVHRGELKGIITESDIFKALFGILTAPAGATILFEEPTGPEGGGDYAPLCHRHGCRIRSLLRYPNPGGGAMVFLSLEGGDAEGIVGELHAASNRVIQVENHPPDPGAPEPAG